MSRIDSDARSLQIVLGIFETLTVTIIGDDLRDTVYVSSSVIGDFLAIETKSELDRVTLDGVLATGILVSTDLGNDIVSVVDVITGEDVGIFTGDGNDTVALENTEIGKSLTVSVDAGNDRVEAFVVAAALDAVFEGGAGTDRFTDLGVSGGTKLDVKEFEVLLP